MRFDRDLKEGISSYLGELDNWPCDILKKQHIEITAFNNLSRRYYMEEKKMLVKDITN